MMVWARRGLAIATLVGLVSSTTLLGPAARHALELSPRHAVAKSRAKVDTPLTQEVLQGMRDRTFATPEDVIAYSLEVTNRHLRFGMQHKTSLRFVAGAEREANCVEYAHLFAHVVETVAHHADVPMRARVVRSRATVLGRPIPMKGWDTHDWVLVASADDTFHIDPTLADAGLGERLEGVLSPPSI